MIGTFQALLVALIAVLPGASYTIARESRGATWAWKQTDTATVIFRFLGASAAFQALFAPVTYRAYQDLVVTHKLADGRALPWCWWLALVAYVFVPYLVGILTEIARNWQHDPCWLKWVISKVTALFAERSPEPRAWDRFFSRQPCGIVRLQLTNDEWKAGLWSDRSFASQYGDDGDLYIEEQYVVGEHGALEREGSDYKSARVGLLISWSEVRYLEFVEWLAPTETAKNGRGGFEQKGGYPGGRKPHPATPQPRPAAFSTPAK